MGHYEENNTMAQETTVLDSLPLFSTELIKGLDELYPLLRYSPGDKLEDVAYYAGMRRVVDDLLAALVRSQAKPERPEDAEEQDDEHHFELVRQSLMTSSLSPEDD